MEAPHHVALRDRLARTGYRIAYAGLRVYWFIARPVTVGVQIAVWHDGRLLVVRNSYRPHIGVPGGGLRRGERPLAAATRELAEEVGIDTTGDALVPFGRVDCRHDGVHDQCHFFELRLAQRPRLTIDRREVIWADFVLPQDLPEPLLHAPLRAYFACRATAQPSTAP